VLGCDGLDGIHVGRFRDQSSVLMNFKSFKRTGALFTKFVILIL
jgi:hypothetical protein